MDLHESTEKFINAFFESIRHGTFAKLTLANYKGPDNGLQKVFARLIETKRGPKISWQIRRDNKDTVKNTGIDASAAELQALLISGFRNAHLFTLSANYQLDIGKRSSRLNIGRPTITSLPSRKHNRTTQEPVDKNAFFLKALGITTDNGEIRAEQRDKWKQINKFTEILSAVITKSELANSECFKIVDFGSGKGYLTFAAYDFLNSNFSKSNSPGRKKITFWGVDARSDLCSLCNDIAVSAEFDGLQFINSTIATFSASELAKALDIVIALHACDTATDDAIFTGITANARVIMVAPCCHREIRRQIGAENAFYEVLKYPLLRERTAESVTDAIRATLLEAFGYNVRMQEFVATEHTPKNNLITAVRPANWKKEPKKIDKVQGLMSLLGIRNQRLYDLLIAKYCN